MDGIGVRGRLVNDATMEHPYRPARVSRGVEFYRGAAAPGRARVGVSSLRRAKINMLSGMI